MDSNFFWRPKSKISSWLVCAKSIFTSILKVSDKFIDKCRRSRLFGEWHLGKMGFWDMTTLVSFWSFFGIEWPIWVWLTSNLVWLNKFEVHISKTWPKWPDATLARALPMVITWPFFIQFWQTNTLKWLSRQDESNGLKS